MRLVICDDHRIVIEGLQRLLEDVPHVECVASATSGPHLLELLEVVATDIVVLDLNMPVMDGTDALGRIKQQWPHLKVIILTMDDSPSSIRAVLERGADGYLLKTCSRDEFLLAVKAVHAGNKHISADVTQVLLNPAMETSRATGRLDVLSVREKEILAALAEGLSNKEIGARLFISHRTVDTHRTNLMKKLGVHNIAELVRIAITEGLVH